MIRFSLDEKPVRRRRVHLFLISLVFSFLSSCSTVPVSDGKRAIPIGTVTEPDRTVVTRILEGMKQEKIEGLSFVLVDGRGPAVRSLKYGLGYADASRKIPATPETRFAGGSTTKIFTAIAIMQLVEEGKVDLDAPLSRYLPDFSIKSRFPVEKPITIRTILTHHSGLPSDYMYNWSSGTIPPASDSVHMEDLPRLLHDDYIAYPPNTTVSYSNLGFALLGDVIERVSGMNAKDYFRKKVFDPIGMKHSVLAVSPADRYGMARGDFDGESIDLPYIRDLTAGSLLTTADDMELFLKCILRGGDPLLKPASLKEMLRIQNEGVARDGSFRIGLTFWRVDLFEGKHPGYGHGGDIGPFHAMVMFLPEDGLGMALYSNSGRYGSMSLVPIAAGTLSHYAGLKTLSHENAAKGSDSGFQGKERASFSQSFDAACSGEYASIMGPISVQVNKGEVYAKAAGLPLHLRVKANGWSSAELDLFHLASIRLGALEPMRLRCRNVAGERAIFMQFNGIEMGPSFSAFPVENVVPPSVWKSRLGFYANSDREPFQMTESIRLYTSAGRGILMGEVKLGKEAGGQKAKVYLKSLNDRELILQGYGRNLGETIQFTTMDGKPTLIFHGSHFQKQ